MASCTYKANGEYICFITNEQNTQTEADLMPCGCKQNQLLNIIQDPANVALPTNIVSTPTTVPTITSQSKVTENMNFYDYEN